MIQPKHPRSLARLDEDEAPATVAETQAALLRRSRRDFAPILNAFVQSPHRGRDPIAPAPLATFVTHGDLRGLHAFLFLHAIISNGERGWSTTLPLATWARALGTTDTAMKSASTAATKILTRLVDRRLIDRSRSGRERRVTVTLLREDGSGAPYTRPDRLFLKLDNAFWLDGWWTRLDLPATAMLLVALHERAGFELPTEKVPSWYGWSADTAERGFRRLRDLGLITVTTRMKKAPLAPEGYTLVNRYTVCEPFAQTERLAAPGGDDA